MTTVDQPRAHSHTTRKPSGSSPPWWLWFSVPIALIGAATSISGMAVDRIYEHETAEWEAQAVGQDIANLVVLGVLVVLAYAAARGSAAALLAWAGTVVYTAYAFAVYSFAVHFGPLFLLHVAELGLSVWALIGFFATLDPRRVRTAFRTPHLERFVSTFLLVVGIAFALLWLSQDLRATVDGSPSAELEDTGLLTNPIHVLDLAFFLPVSVLAGVLLRRGRTWGHALAPIVLAAMAGISLGIVSLTLVNVARHQEASLSVGVVIGLLGAVQAAACWRFLSGMDRSATTDIVVGRGDRS